MSKTDDTRPGGEVRIRVRYAETDRMGFLHHANHLVYFEQARTELLRDRGGDYRRLEDEGFFLVITKAEVRYRRPAQYDDLLTLKVRLTRSSPVRLEHGYELRRGDELLAEGSTTLACVDRAGKVTALPDWFMRVIEE